MEYTLKDQKFIDGVETNLEYPDTFKIPSMEDKEAIAVGDSIKVGFISDDPYTPTERMWLKVIEVDGSLIKGSLENYPVCVEGYYYGDIFQVHSDHVLSIMPWSSLI